MGHMHVEPANPSDPGDQSTRVTYSDGRVEVLNEWGQVVSETPAPSAATIKRDGYLGGLPPGPRVRDSGERHTFSTGSRRDSSVGKGRFDLMAWLPLFRVAAVYEQGDVKYGAGFDGQPRNWEKGQPFSRLFSSAIRHLLMWWLRFDEEDHLAQACWNVLAIMHFEDTGQAGPPIEGATLLDDRPTYADSSREVLLKRFEQWRATIGEMHKEQEARSGRTNHA